MTDTEKLALEQIRILRSAKPALKILAEIFEDDLTISEAVKNTEAALQGEIQFFMNELKAAAN